MEAFNHRWVQGVQCGKFSRLGEVLGLENISRLGKFRGLGISELGKLKNSFDTTFEFDDFTLDFLSLKLRFINP